MAGLLVRGNRKFVKEEARSIAGVLRREYPKMFAFALDSGGVELYGTRSQSFISTSVADPDQNQVPDPLDQHVFWPLGSGSGSTCQSYGSG